VASNPDPVRLYFVVRTPPPGVEGAHEELPPLEKEHLLVQGQKNTSSYTSGVEESRELDEFQAAELESNLESGWPDPAGKQ